MNHKNTAPDYGNWVPIAMMKGMAAVLFALPFRRKTDGFPRLSGFPGDSANDVAFCATSCYIVPLNRKEGLP